MARKVLVTGAAGFIGFFVMSALARRGEDVIGVDNINDYYDVRLKYGRLGECGFPDRAAVDSGAMLESSRYPGCRFRKLDVTDKERLDALFAEAHFDAVVHLAAQPGVRYSISHPYAYLLNNVTGFLNILEACRQEHVAHLVYASSSSVYGLHAQPLCREDDRTDSPVSLYAATKKSNELMAYSYAKLYGMAVSGLRFFTVYGPWGRPDMSPMLFASAIRKGEPIRVFNHGDMSRDFTYIDDIVGGLVRVLDRQPGPDADGVRARICNIGSSRPVRLLDFIAELERAMGGTAPKTFLPMQPGDVYATWADTGRLEKETGYKPCVSLQDGLRAFAGWYCSAQNPLV
ncbi:MAG: NAD-dependent epimerase/dehydratase family protein [Bacteroidales bacterium]|nr:NAD-dependent epimerase/dehydratase family protein [Bacteroidales bacterium]